MRPGDCALPARLATVAYAGFATFGAFWGTWGASVPAVREQAGLSDGQLGTALLFVGAGALPAMLFAGRAVDRWGHRVTVSLLAALGGTGVVATSTGHGFVSLSIGLAALGAVSGATDVAINAAAGSAEQASGRPVITRAHGVFSAAVVVASLATGVLRGHEVAVVLPFLGVAVVAVAASGLTFVGARPGTPESGPDTPPQQPTPVRRCGPGFKLLSLMAIGGLGALAFAVENAHQSWSALYLGDVLSAGPSAAAAGPAVFAAVVAVTRFAVGALNGGHACATVISGATTTAIGALVLSNAATVPIALFGLGVAAAGTAVLYPTLLSLVAMEVTETARGAATSIVATVAYLGFLAGPVYVGAWSAAVGLRGAMLAVAALGAALALFAWPVIHRITARTSRTDNDRLRTRPRAAERPQTMTIDQVAHRMFVRNSIDYAHPAMIELAWEDPDVRAFWLAEATAVTDDLLSGWQS